MQTASLIIKRHFIASVFERKRDGAIKAKAFADVRKWRESINKYDVASPTAALKYIFITTAIDAKEHWEVTIMDSPGAFLHAYNDEKVVMIMRGKMAELMARVALKIYRKNITTIKNGENFLNIRVQKGHVWHVSQ